MKQIFILLAGLSIFTLTCPAQNKPEKSKYDIKSYTYMSDDRYDPTNISIASAILPGLGQMICDEEFGPMARTRTRVGLAIAATSWLWSLIDAPRTATLNF